jgi:hypothetical protein
MDEATQAAVKPNPAEVVAEPMIRHTLVAVFDAAKSLLVIKGTLLAPSELAHEHLVALLDEENPPAVEVEFKTVRDVVTFQATLKHTKDIATAGHAALKLRHEARDRGVSVADLKAEKAAAEKAAKKPPKPKESSPAN